LVKRTLSSSTGRLFLLLVVLGLLLAANAAALAAAKPAPRPAAARPTCTQCHKSFDGVLPQGHPSVAGKDLTACLACHAPADSDKPAPNPFSAALHRAHEQGTTRLDCTFCHTWNPGKSFGLLGVKTSYGAPSKDDVAALKESVYSWVSSGYVDALHAKQNITCEACHGQSLPAPGDRVENEQCFKCHGSYADLAKLTVNPDHPDRNPHGSHLGDIPCNACHKAHSPSKAYCNGCHPKFDMKIVGAAAQ
jgi:hypothetical protein